MRKGFDRITVSRGYGIGYGRYPWLDPEYEECRPIARVRVASQEYGRSTVMIWA